MRATILITAFLHTLALAAPLPTNLVDSALRLRQSNGSLEEGAGSTTDSVTENNGLLNLGLTGGSAAAGDDAHDTSTASTSYCGLLACTSGAASSGPNGTDTSTSTSKAFGK